MIDKTKNQILVGLILIIVSFICAVIILYFMGSKNRAQLGKISSLEAQLSNLINEEAGPRMSADEYRRARQKPISLEDLIDRARDSYGEDEISRNEGILWIDRETSLTMVTLGAIHGLEPGSYLDIYKDNTQIGSARVDTPLDIISYVVLVEKSPDELDNNYYNVVIRK